MAAYKQALTRGKQSSAQTWVVHSPLGIVNNSIAATDGPVHPHHTLHFVSRNGGGHCMVLTALHCSVLRCIVLKWDLLVTVGSSRRVRTVRLAQQT
jgi:hypothetical protein